MKNIKKNISFVLIATLFVGLPITFTSCSSTEAVMIGVAPQSLDNTHEIGRFKVSASKSKKTKLKQRLNQNETRIHFNKSKK